MTMLFPLVVRIKDWTPARRSHNCDCRWWRICPRCYGPVRAVARVNLSYVCIGRGFLAFVMPSWDLVRACGRPHAGHEWDRSARPLAVFGTSRADRFDHGLSGS